MNREINSNDNEIQTSERKKEFVTEFVLTDDFLGEGLM